MATSHDGIIGELQRRLSEALARGDDKVVRNLLASIGRLELSTKAPKNGVRPASNDHDSTSSDDPWLPTL